MEGAAGPQQGRMFVFELTPTGGAAVDSLDLALSGESACDGRVWMVAHTRPRQEKALSMELAQLGVTHYLPTLRAERSYRTKKTFVDLPLFPGYVFLFASAVDRLESLRTHRVVDTICVHDQGQFKSDVQHIRRVIASKEMISLYPSLKRGSKCRVTTGPLKGVCGVVVGYRHKRTLYVSVNALGQSVGLEIDAAWLEPWE